MKPVLLKPLRLHNLPLIKHPISRSLLPFPELGVFEIFNKSIGIFVAFSYYLMWREGSTMSGPKVCRRGELLQVCKVGISLGL